MTLWPAENEARAAAKPDSVGEGTNSSAAQRGRPHPSTHTDMKITTYTYITTTPCMIIHTLCMKKASSSVKVCLNAWMVL